MKTALKLCTASLLTTAILAGTNFEAQAASRPIVSLPGLNLTMLGTYGAGVFDRGGAEIVAHDPLTQRLFVVNAQAASLDVLDISNPATLTKVDSILLGIYTGGGIANSVAARDGIIAVAVEAPVKTDPGFVVFFDNSLAPLASVNVGALPDMLTFSPDGRHVLVANEGEPSSYNPTNGVDPEGSVSVIDLSHGAANLTQDDVRTADFHAYIGREAELRQAGVRIFGPNANAAQDLEPEYIAISQDSKIAYVTLQEANAMAVVDIEGAQVTSITSLGYKDHNLADNGFGSSNALDVSDRDNAAGTGPAINIRNMPILGLYQPDSIASYEVQGQTFLVMANEGDTRDYPPDFSEEITVGSSGYILDPATFPNATTLKSNSFLGRLTVSKVDGLKPGETNVYSQIFSFGGRSFSIRKPDGQLVFDSGDQFERITAAAYPSNFNASHTANAIDGRSRSKGPEPEGVAIGRAFGRVFAFIGLERIGGVMVYDITDPYAVRFVNYFNHRDFWATPLFTGTAPNRVPNPAVGDLGPEGVIFISQDNSPTGNPLLVLGNEVSATTTVIELTKAK